MSLCEPCWQQWQKWLHYRLIKPIQIIQIGNGVRAVKDRQQLRVEEWRTTIRTQQQLIVDICERTHQEAQPALFDEADVPVLQPRSGIARRRRPVETVHLPDEVAS